MSEISATMLRRDHDVLRHALLDIGLKFGAGVSVKGTHVAWVMDCREVLLDAHYLRIAGRLLWQRLRPYRPDMVGGTTMSADPLIAAMLYEAAEEGYPLRGCIIRKQPKTYGLRKLVEGPPITSGTRMILLDDLVSSGTTIRRAMKAVELFGANVVAVGVVIDFQRKGAQWLRERILPIEALFSLGDLGLARQRPSGSVAAKLCWIWEGLNSTRDTIPKSSPCLVGDILYVGSDNGFMLALTRAGIQLWRYPVRNRTYGIHSSPLIHDGRVYFGARDGYMYCLSADSGTLIWDAQCGTAIGSSPAIDPSRMMIFVGTKQGQSGGSLMALNAETGELRWRFRARCYIHSSPCFDAPRSQVLVGSNDYTVYAIDAQTGYLRWQFRTDGAVKGRTAVDDLGRCFVGSFDGYLYALDAKTGNLLWRRKLSHRLYTDPLIFQDLVIVGGYSGHIVALECLRGTVRWVAATGARIIGGATLVRNNIVMIGSTDGAIYLVDATCGDVLWRYQTNGPIRATPAADLSFAAVPSFDGNLYAFSW